MTDLEQYLDTGHKVGQLTEGPSGNQSRDDLKDCLIQQICLPSRKKTFIFVLKKNMKKVKHFCLANFNLVVIPLVFRRVKKKFRLKKHKKVKNNFTVNFKLGVMPLVFKRVKK